MKHLALAAALLAANSVSAQQAVEFPGPRSGLTLTALEYRPSGPGPYPAVVLLHGCAGMYTSRGSVIPAYASWAETFRARGYLALLVDSFGPRGETEICTQRVRSVTAERDRPEDAGAALRWLAARPDVDAKSIHLMGWSHGGATTLHAVQRGGELHIRGGPSFKSAVAMYPGCGGMLTHTYEATVPVLIQAGGADDWTPAAECEQLAARSGGSVTIDVHPGAHHAFDRPGSQVIYRPEVRNRASKTGRGAHLGGHPEARRRSFARVPEFFDAHR